MDRKPYATDVSDEEWAFVAPYLAWVREDAPQRTHDLRELFKALRGRVNRSRFANCVWVSTSHAQPQWIETQSPGCARSVKPRPST